jgi:hypothetical protein
MSELQCLIYVSTAVNGLRPLDVATIISKSSERNQHAGVHGMLLLSDGNFMQCIEGGIDGVESTYARIRASRLHHRVIEMARIRVARRRFDAWEWAFKMGSQVHFSNPNIEQFLEKPWHELPLDLSELMVEQRILRDFWDTTTRPQQIW